MATHRAIQERLKIFNQERQGQQPTTAEERRRIFFQEQAAKYQQPPAEQRAQQQRPLTIEEALRRPVIDQSAPITIDEALRRPVIGQHQAQRQTQPEDSFLSSIVLGGKQELTRLVKAGVSIADALGHAAVGDFQPLIDIAELYGQGSLKTFTTRQYDPKTGTFPASAFLPNSNTKPLPY